MPGSRPRTTRRSRPADVCRRGGDGEATAPLPGPDQAGGPAKHGAAGILFVVATPIGNLGEITPRALETLRTVDLIAAEDTRRTRRLLAHFNIHTPLQAHHAHSSPQVAAELVQRLRGGARIALVCDAGTPGISDPGSELVAAARAAGATVTPVSGPCAAIAAVSASGLGSGRFVFEGFLPRAAGARRAALARLRGLPHSLVFYEAPGRVEPTLRVLAAELGDREAVVAREISKLHEEFARGSLLQLAERFRAAPPRGEFVIVVKGADDAPACPPAGWEELLDQLLDEGLSARDASRRVAEETGAPRSSAYRRALARRPG